MKKRTVCLLVLFLLLLAVVGLLIYGNGMEVSEQENIHVIFVPGLWTEDNAEDMYREWLEEAFPGCEISIRQWKSNRVLWERAKLDADLLAGELAKEVFAMTEAERENLVLVGHSLGARVVIRAMSDINGYGMSIRRGIFLGAALPDDDECIAKALLASRCPCINVSNRKDNVLSVIYSSVVADHELCALGAYGSKDKYPEASMVDVRIAENGEEHQDDSTIWNVLKNVIQKNLDNYQRHYAELYFDELKATLENDELVPILNPTMKLRRFTRRFKMWSTVSKSFKWELKRHWLTRQLAIVNPAGVMVAVGDSNEIKEGFDELKRQLQDADLRNNLKINVMQEDEVAVEKVLPIDALWKTVDEFDGWQLQKSKYGGNYRIVDPRDFLRASGGEEKMRESFNAIREQLTNGILM